MTNANVLGAAASIIIIVTLFEMLRRHRLREKYGRAVPLEPER